jgi:hypothetical protein
MYQEKHKDEELANLRDMWATIYFEEHPCKHMVAPEDMADEAYAHADAMLRARGESR